MKNTKKSLITMSLAFLLISMVIPMFLINNVSAVGNEEALNVSYEPYRNGKWWKIQTELITILFPAGGKKPMFLWWYSNDTNNVYVVKYKGLIEYLRLDYPHYMHRYEANQLTIQERLEAKYSTPMPEPHRTRVRNMIRAYMGWLLESHPPYLPFSACQWNLTGPISVTRSDGVSHISFNFTLIKAPPTFEFAENNVIIRCRFYTTDATENVHGLYNYTVHAGELKMDLIVKNWEWNIDKIRELFYTLSDEFNITVPNVLTGLALWVDLASIEIVDLPIAEQDINSTMTESTSFATPCEPIEIHSTTSDIIAGRQRINVRQSMVGSDEIPINVGNPLHERFKLRFAKGSETLAGFFDFVNTAVVINSTTGEPSTVDVTAAYIPAGNHMRLFIGYPYFSSNTLEHDPSIGVESVVPWLPTGLLMILIGVTIAIAVAVAAVKLRKKTVNIVNVQ